MKAGLSSGCAESSSLRSFPSIPTGEGETPVSSLRCSRLSKGTVELLFPQNCQGKDNLQVLSHSPDEEAAGWAVEWGTTLALGAALANRE